MRICFTYSPAFSQPDCEPLKTENMFSLCSVMIPPPQRPTAKMLVAPFLRQLWLITVKVAGPENPSFKGWEVTVEVTEPTALYDAHVCSLLSATRLHSLHEMCEIHQNIQARALTLTTFVCASKFFS